MGTFTKYPPNAILSDSHLALQELILGRYALERDQICDDLSPCMLVQSWAQGRMLGKRQGSSVLSKRSEPNMQRFRISWIYSLATLLLLSGFLAGCGSEQELKPTSTPTSSPTPELTPTPTPTAAGSIRLTVEVSPSQLRIGASESGGTLTLTVENVGTDDTEVDLWADVLPGIHFSEGLRQKLSDDSQQVTRSGVPMRPTETRVVDFHFELDDTVDPGLYVIEVNASSSSEDVAMATVQVQVLR